MSAIHAENFTEQLFRTIRKGYLRTEKIDYSDDRTEIKYSIFNNQHKNLVTFRARPLPGCCGVLVVYYLRPSSKTKDPIKVFKETLSLIIEAAGLAKFGNVLLTQTVESSGMKALMDDSSAFMFTNWKTNNKIGTFQFATKCPTSEKEINFDGE